jgi:DNA (cytosine-5)-methyltransferase 1
MTNTSLKLVDLFCGPGGISEGFRTAGIPTLFAVDYDKDACATFSLNHPEATVVCADVLTIDPESIPDADIIVGGPPCVNFSTSKGSRANVLDGLKLVQWFLRVIAAKRPRYWIMENVPRIAKHLPEEIPFSWIGLDDNSVLSVPRRDFFNSADFGVAQTRIRYLVGNYPTPIPTHSSRDDIDLFAPKTRLGWRSLHEILIALEQKDSIKDPNYGFEIPQDLLTDHSIDTVIAAPELDRIRAAKEEHPYMGRMAFPDDISKPARTIVATQLGRETMVLRHGNKYRRPTVRECATIQSFPITYQFTGNSLSSRYRQAGDAVAPLLAFSIAREISKLSKANVRSSIIKLAPPAKTGFKRSSKQSVKPFRTFTQMIPGKEIRGARVEVDNRNFVKTHGKDPVIWSARLHLGEGKGKARVYTFDLKEIKNIIDSLSSLDSQFQKNFYSFFSGTKDYLFSKNWNSIELQECWARFEIEGYSPRIVTTALGALVDKNFPKRSFFDRKLNIPVGRDKFEAIRIRHLAALICSTLWCEYLRDPKAVKKLLSDYSKTKAKISI